MNFNGQAFWTLFNKRLRTRDYFGQRVGQVAFNLLLEIDPAMAESIRGTEADPFNAVSLKNDSFQNFVRFISEEL